MLKTVFTLKLNEKILPRRVAVGKFDGTNPCIVAASSSDKVFVHNPHSRSLNPDGRWIIGGGSSGSSASADSDINYLSINQTVNALATGQLRAMKAKERDAGEKDRGKERERNENRMNAGNITARRKASIESASGQPVSLPHNKAHRQGGGFGVGQGQESSSSIIGMNNDVLVIGTPTSILVYDVIQNTDLFYREIPDGANTVVVGEIGSIGKPLAIAGGNCALQGFDEEGNDCYWTVTGDNITSLVLCDINEDGINELLVGSDDADIRIFQEDAIQYEIAETDAVTCICSIGPNTFGYALSNGTVGVYHKKDRLWRIKSKNTAVSIHAYDVNSDGVPELVTGWSNGKLDVRMIDSGEVIFKDNLISPIAAILVSDYNMDGMDELIVITTEGEIRGYISSSPQERQQVIDASYEQDTIRELMKRKQNLTLELRNYEENIRIQQVADPFVARGKPSMEGDEFGAIPANTQLKSALVINMSDKIPSIELTLCTNNDTIIRAIIIFAEGIFNGESQVIHAQETQLSNEILVPLRPPKDVPIDLHIKALVGYKSSFHYHVFELTRHLPRFAMFSLKEASGIVGEDGNENESDNYNPSMKVKSIKSAQYKSKSYVSFTLNERIGRIQSWFNENFLFPDDIEFNESSLEISFVPLRLSEYQNQSKLLYFNMTQDDTFSIHTDNMELAGELVQSLCGQYLGLQDLPSTAEFPAEIETLKKLIARVEELESVRQQLSAEIADNSAAIRTLVVRAEDARLIGEIKLMKQHYLDLNVLNNELITEYKIRCQNHLDLVDSLKQINVIIQKAGNLRIGKPKTELIQACRNAIKQNNLNVLTKIITTGDG